MPSRCSYRLIATAGMDARNLCDFLELFKARQINIQKLVMLQHGLENGMPRCELEVLFVLPQEQHPFLDELEVCLKRPEWREKTLSPL